MARITISRLFEISKYLKTQAGQDLEGALTYLSEFAEVALRNLRNGLTFADNFDCLLKSVSLRTDTETVVTIAGGKRAKGVILLKTADPVYYVVTKFGWKYGADGNLVVFATLSDISGVAPAAATLVTLDLLLVFG